MAWLQRRNDRLGFGRSISSCPRSPFRESQVDEHVPRRKRQPSSQPQPVWKGWASESVRVSEVGGQR